MIEVCYPAKTRQNNKKSPTCLTSLDELIAAHGQKLDALKTHKKGLMQQLFPAKAKPSPPPLPRIPRRTRNGLAIISRVHIFETSVLGEHA